LQLFYFHAERPAYGHENTPGDPQQLSPESIANRQLFPDLRYHYLTGF
jgi:hypothetical protein